VICRKISQPNTPLNSLPRTSIKTFEPRDLSILNSTYSSALKTHVQNLSPFSLCPVSSTFTIVSKGRRSSSSLYGASRERDTFSITLRRYPRETFSPRTSLMYFLIVEMMRGRHSSCRLPALLGVL